MLHLLLRCGARSGEASMYIEEKRVWNTQQAKSNDMHESCSSKSSLRGQIRANTNFVQQRRAFRLGKHQSPASDALLAWFFPVTQGPMFSEGAWEIGLRRSSMQISWRLRCCVFFCCLFSCWATAIAFHETYDRLWRPQLHGCCVHNSASVPRGAMLRPMQKWTWRETFCRHCTNGKNTVNPKNQNQTIAGPLQDLFAKCSWRGNYSRTKDPSGGLKWSLRDKARTLQKVWKRGH